MKLLNDFLKNKKINTHAYMETIEYFKPHRRNFASSILVRLLES